MRKCSAIWRIPDTDVAFPCNVLDLDPEDGRVHPYHDIHDYRGEHLSLQWTDEERFAYRAPSSAGGMISEAAKERLPRHAADCAIVTTHHLTCTCGALTRAVRAAT